MGRSSTVFYAQESGGASGFLPIAMIVLLFGVMYFMMIRPQQKRRREAEQMQRSIGPGDEVVTIGGLYGTVTGVDDETVMIEVAPGVQTRYARPAIARLVNAPERPSESSAEPATDEAEVKD
jgi:preprotein translocase subunit YajC